MSYFNAQPAFGEKVIYDPVIAGSRPHPHLMDRQQVANPHRSLGNGA